VHFNDEENQFLIAFGESLAGTMFYGGNSYLQPRDDAPRVADIFANPGKGILQVGIDRPRALWVLYPTKDGEVLCRGAVLPYCEFTAGQRLTDGDWRARLDGPGRPVTPDWLAPIVAPEGLGGVAPPKD
jgi:hypothetical protein